MFPSALAVERPGNTGPPALWGWSPRAPHRPRSWRWKRDHPTGRVSARSPGNPGRTTFSPADTAHGKLLLPPLVCISIKENLWGFLMERGICLILRLWELPGWYRGLRALLDPVRISSCCGAVQFSRRARSWHSALSFQAAEEQESSPPPCTAE